MVDLYKPMEKASTHPKPTKVSVLIPCYHQAQFLPEALDSVLHQDFHDLEVIASDDASPDNSFSVLQDYSRRDSRIRIFRQTTNLGMVENWNFCLRQAQGEAVKLMGGDDRLDRPDCLSRQWQSLQTPRVALVACSRKIIDADGRFLECIANLPRGYLPPAKIIPKMLEHQDNLLGEPVCCLFRRKDATRGFHPEYLQNTDIEMWFHILRFGGLAYDAEPLVAFRRHPDQNTNIHNKSGLSLEEHCLLILKQSSGRHISSACKAHVLHYADNALRITDSMEIRRAAQQLNLEMSWADALRAKILFRIRRTLHRWNRSISKRIPL